MLLDKTWQLQEWWLIEVLAIHSIVVYKKKTCKVIIIRRNIINVNFMLSSIKLMFKLEEQVQVVVFCNLTNLINNGTKYLIE